MGVAPGRCPGCSRRRQGGEGCDRRLRLLLEFRDWLGENERLGASSLTLESPDRHMPIDAEEDDSAVFLAGQIRLIAHVGDGHLVVPNGALAERPGVVARPTIELVQPASVPRNHPGVRVDTPRNVDGNLFPQK